MLLNSSVLIIFSKFWLLETKQLFETLKKLTREKFKGTPKFQNMQKKIDHVHQFMVAAEHHCRFFKAKILNNNY